MASMLHAVGNDDLPRLPLEQGSLAMPLSARLEDKRDKVEACVQAVRTHGVIEHDPAVSGQYRFSHKSFAEVLAAEALVEACFNGSSAALRPFTVSQRRELISQDVVFWFAADLAFDTSAGARPLNAFSAIRILYPRAIVMLANVNFVVAAMVSTLAGAMARLGDKLSGPISAFIAALMALLPLRGASGPTGDDDHLFAVANRREMEEQMNRLFRISAFGLLALGSIVGAVGISLSLSKEIFVALALPAVGMFFAFLSEKILKKLDLMPFNDATQFAHMIERISRVAPDQRNIALSDRFRGLNLIDEIIRVRLMNAEMRGR